MKDLVLDRLSKMEDLGQRSLLKSLMTGVFLHFTEYQEEMNRQLESRVFQEIAGHSMQNNLYVSLSAREDVDPLHEYLYPMLPSDVNPPVIDMRQLGTAWREGAPACLATIFMECSYSKLHALLQSDREFEGHIKTKSGTHAIRVRLRQNRAYIEEIENLYRVFSINGLPWKTIQHPYAYKFVDLLLVGGDSGWTDEDELLEIQVQLEEFEIYKRTNLVPLWNIQRIQLKTNGFPVPASDRVNYEHMLSLREMGVQHGYLIDGDASMIRYIKRMPEQMIVVSPQDKSDVWQLLKVAEPKESRIAKYVYPVLSNRRKDSFIQEYGERQHRVIRSKGEILRILEGYDSVHELELAGLEIREPHETDHRQFISRRQVVTQELNRFISDEIRPSVGKRRMVLRFKRRASDQQHLPTADREAFLLEDKMSFVVAEIQIFFPEYECEGEWA